MKRIKIFVGGPGTGKTKKALEKAEIIGMEKSVFINGIINPDYFIQPSFVFQHCTPETKLVVIDEFTRTKKLFGTFVSLIHGIRVHKHCKEPFNIEPDIIIICNEVPKDMGAPAFDHRFSVIQFPEQIELNPIS